MPNINLLQSPELPRLAFTMEETAEIFTISYTSVQRLVARGLLRASTALRHKRISRVEIERFLKATTPE
jgi:hypothetical protein